MRKTLVAFSVVLAHLLMGTSAPSLAADLVVVQVAPMTGPQAAGATANYIGAKAHFDQINAQGGVNGQKVRFIVEDDQYKPEETIRLVQEVASRDKPVAFINLTGSSSVAALLKDKTLDRVGVPVIGVTPGSEALRSPGHPMLFHVHAGDRAQLNRIVSHLSTLGISKIGIAYQDTPFGKAALGFVDELAPAMKTSVVARVSVPSAGEDLKPAVEQLRQSGAQTYVMLLQPSSGAAFVRDARAIGDKTPIYGMSYIPVKALVEKASLANATGTALAQVTPNPSASTSGLTRDFHATMDKYAPPGTTHSQLHLIGYLTARVTAEAMRRAGTAPTAERVATSLRQLRVDFGGYNIDFSASNNNVGSQFVDIGVVDRTGRLMY